MDAVFSQSNSRARTTAWTVVTTMAEPGSPITGLSSTRETWSADKVRKKQHVAFNDPNEFFAGCVGPDDCDSATSYCDTDSCRCQEIKCSPRFESGFLLNVDIAVNSVNHLQCEEGIGTYN